MKNQLEVGRTWSSLRRARRSAAAVEALLSEYGTCKTVKARFWLGCQVKVLKAIRVVPSYLELFETRAPLGCLEPPLQLLHVQGLPGNKGYEPRKAKL